MTRLVKSHCFGNFRRLPDGLRSLITSPTRRLSKILVDPKTFKGYPETSGRFPKMTKKFRSFQTKSNGRSANISDSYPKIVDITRCPDQTISAPFVMLSKFCFGKFVVTNVHKTIALHKSNLVNKISCQLQCTKCRRNVRKYVLVEKALTLNKYKTS